MSKHLTIILVLALMGCTSSPMQPKPTASAEPVSMAQTLSLPAGFSVIEQQPDGYFIRVASSSTAPLVDVRAVADAVGTRYDRIDFCTAGEYGRGDEYLSVIGRTVYDYANDEIFSLDNVR